MERSKNKLFFLFGTLLLVLLIYIPSLNRDWLFFDERILKDESLFPTPSSISEIFEIIKYFVLNCHLESMNTFFSSQLSVRSEPILTSISVVLMSYFFKKNPFPYHTLQLLIHLINTALIWVIFYKITKLFSNKISLPNLFLISLFTAIWALHSANTEAVLLATNWNMIFTYTFCFGFILYETFKIIDNDFKVTSLEFFLIPALVLLSMFFAEHAYTFPLVIFFFIFAYTYKKIGSIREAGVTSFKLSSPYFIGIAIFVLYSFIRNNPATKSFLGSNTTYLFIERNLWLVPQIFLSFLKLLLFPKTLSTYQSNLIHLSSTLFDLHSVLCTLLYLFFILSPVILLFSRKNQDIRLICLLIYAFYFALFPFLHVLSPNYCLIADRYCYFPSFILLVILFSVFHSLIDQKKLKSALILLSSLLLLLSGRTIIRIQDWSNGDKLLESAIKIENNPLYKAQKLITYTTQLQIKGKKASAKKSLEGSLPFLKMALKQFKILRKKYPSQPAILQSYGLDYDSLIIKTAYLITTVKEDYYHEDAKKILAFYEPYIKNKLHLAFINEIAMYANILVKAGQTDKAVQVLENAHNRFLYCSSILHSLSNYYLISNKTLEKAFDILQYAYKYYPGDLQTLIQFFRYYTLKNDLENQAKFAYLIGLRSHSTKAYQKAAQIHLDLKGQKI
ncbi:MAG: hypothetical protein HY094_07985 [Candidatus Melainabacteria bacterium]|nr:hypothetical protein [Candidatus Melainabacteria bacterium]